MWRPERLPWLGDRERQPARDGDWWYSRGMLHPEGLLRLARARHCAAIVFAENEPLLSVELTYDLARLAKAAGLRVVVYSNGFSEPAVIRKLAPYVDSVDLGVKLSLDPEAYARLMKSPGATEVVKRSMLEWRAAGVHLLISDLIATPIQQADEAIVDAAPRLYAWIARELGEHTPVLHAHMHPPDNARSNATYLVPQRPTAIRRYSARLDWVCDQARAAGLHYGHLSTAGLRLTCHACGGLLLQYHPPRTATGVPCPRQAADPPGPCAMFTAYCNCWSHTQHVTDGKCDHCGAGVPIVTLSRDELAAARRHVAKTTAAAAS